MSLPLTPASPFVAATSVIPSSVLNAWRTFFPACLDADGGGTYANTAPIIFSAGSAGWEFDSGLTIGATGSLTVAVGGTMTANGTTVIAGSLSVTGAASLTNVTQFTRTGRARRRPRVILAADSNHTVDTSQGDCFELNFTPSVTRNIILRTSTAPVPDANELIEIVSGSGVFAGTMFSIQREDGTVICTFRSVATVGALIAAQFEFDAGVWRLGLNSGRTWDAGAGANIVGVVPGAGA